MKKSLFLLLVAILITACAPPRAAYLYHHVDVHVVVLRRRGRRLVRQQLVHGPERSRRLHRLGHRVPLRGRLHQQL